MTRRALLAALAALPAALFAGCRRYVVPAFASASPREFIDGLSSSLWRLANGSEVSFEIDYDPDAGRSGPFVGLRSDGGLAVPGQIEATIRRLVADELALREDRAFMIGGQS